MEPTLPNSLRDKRASFVLKWKPVVALQTSLIMQLWMSYVQGQNHVHQNHKTRLFGDIWFDQEGDTWSNGILAFYIAWQHSRLWMVTPDSDDIERPPTNLEPNVVDVNQVTFLCISLLSCLIDWSCMNDYVSGDVRIPVGPWSLWCWMLAFHSSSFLHCLISFQIVFLEENIHWPSILHFLIQFILNHVANRTQNCRFIIYFSD